MGFRFFKRFQLAPGVTLNVSKGGASLSVGPRGAKVTIGTSGAQLTLGVPGTGLYWTKKLGSVFGDDEPASRKNAAQKAVDTTSARPAAETAWADGLDALSAERLPEAVEQLGRAWEGRASLRGGRAKLSVTVALTPELSLALVPDRRGAGLAYAESLQASGRRDEAAEILRALKEEADAPVVRAALAEIELERGDAAAALAVCGRSRDPVVAMYRARALLAAGRPADARAEVERIRVQLPEQLRDDLDEIIAAAERA